MIFSETILSIYQNTYLHRPFRRQRCVLFLNIHSSWNRLRAPAGCQSRCTLPEASRPSPPLRRTPCLRPRRRQSPPGLVDGPLCALPVLEAALLHAPSPPVSRIQPLRSSWGVCRRASVPGISLTLRNRKNRLRCLGIWFRQVRIPGVLLCFP